MDVRRRRDAPEMRHDQAARDLCAGDDSRRQAGDHKGALVAIQLEEVWLHRVEGIDRHAARERGFEHDPSDGRVAEPMRDRCAQDASDFLHEAFVANRRESDVAHEHVGEPKGDHQDERTQQIGNSQVGRLRDEPSSNGSAQHRGALNDLAFRKHRLELVLRYRNIP